MKKSVLFIVATILISALIVNVHCKNKKDKVKFTAQLPDTTRVPAVFVNYPNKNILVGIVGITSRDTVVYGNIDTSGDKISGERIRVRDSIFYAPRTDSSGNYIKETSGMPKYYPIFPKAVSLIRDVDSAFKVLDKWVKDNPQLFPADTTNKQ